MLVVSTLTSAHLDPFLLGWQQPLWSRQTNLASCLVSQPPPVLPLSPTAHTPSRELPRDKLLYTRSEGLSEITSCSILGFIPVISAVPSLTTILPAPAFLLAPSAPPSVPGTPLPAESTKLPALAWLGCEFSFWDFPSLQPAGSLTWKGETLFLASGQLLSKTKVQGKSLFPWSAGDSHWLL